MFPMFPAGDLVWVDGLCVLQDASGQERMAVHYSRRESLEKQLEHGLAPLIPKKTDLKFSCHSILRINGSISEGTL